MTRSGLVAVGLVLALGSCATPAAAPLKVTAATQSGRSGKGVAIADLDRKADPCSDFDDFASGAWRAAHPIPAGKPKWSRRLVGREANEHRVRALLEEIARREDWPRGSAEQVAGDHFASCMDEAKIEAAGRAPLDPWLAQIDATRTAADVQRIVRRLHAIGVSAAFATNGAFDYQEPLHFVANVGPGTLGLPDRDSYVSAEPSSAERRAKYQAHVARVLASAGVADAEAGRAAAGILALERRLAEASLPGAQAADPAATSHKTTFVELEKLAPHVDWRTYFDEAGMPRVDLNVTEPVFLRRLDEELERTPLPVWKAYLEWRLLDAVGPSLARSFAAASAEPGKGPEGASKERAQVCAESTLDLFGEAVGRTYVERYFSPAAKARAQEMARALLAELRDEVPRFGWMTPETKARALEKLTTVNVQVGYPDTWKDLSTVAVKRGSFWDNVVAGRKLKVDENRRLIGKPTDRGSWLLPPSSADAYLEPQLNELVLPAGFLQPPAFDPDATDAVNYGAIGAGLAHDLFHSIDTLGADFDVDGRPRGWWLEADRQALAERGACVSRQFEGYAIAPGVRHQGKRVLGEAIGDLVGTRVAYLAFERSAERRAAPTVDGLTPEQQFFVALAQLRGDEMSLEAQQKHVQSDIHPIAKYRILGTLSNLPEFQSAFACKAGSAMVRPPEERCGVW